MHVTVTLRRDGPLLIYTAKLQQHPKNLNDLHQVKCQSSASAPGHRTLPVRRKRPMADSPNNVSFTHQVFSGTSHSVRQL